MYINLTTQRLNIKPITKNDALFILKLVNSEGWIKNIGDRNIKNIEKAKDYIESILNNNEYYYLVFEEKTTLRAIGIITFLKKPNNEYPDLGFAILPEYEKMGYAFEAANIYLNELIKQKVSDKILGITIPSNVKSIRLLQRLGFTFVKTEIQAEETLSIYSLNIV